LCCVSELAAISSRFSTSLSIQCFCIPVSLPTLFLILTQLSSPAASRAMQTRCLALHPVMSTDDADILCAEALLHCANDSLSLFPLQSYMTDQHAEHFRQVQQWHRRSQACRFCSSADLMFLTSAAVERHLTAEQHAEQLRQVQSMWQMAAVLEFLHTFSLYLQLRGSFTPEELEVAIVSEAPQTGLLANLHQVLYFAGARVPCNLTEQCCSARHFDTYGSSRKFNKQWTTCACLTTGPNSLARCM